MSAAARGVRREVVTFKAAPSSARTSSSEATPPSNPLLKVVDLAALAEIAHGGGAQLLVDGTFATPALQRPVELGADIVLQSTTKYLGGHSDVQGGALVFREESDFLRQVLHVRRVIGGVASPFNSWLVLRGIRSLAARMRIHSENARKVAAFLEAHPAVRGVQGVREMLFAPVRFTRLLAVPLANRLEHQGVDAA